MAQTGQVAAGPRQSEARPHTMYGIRGSLFLSPSDRDDVLQAQVRALQ
jgi:hypothetical protein